MVVHHHVGAVELGLGRGEASSDQVEGAHGAMGGSLRGGGEGFIFLGGGAAASRAHRVVGMEAGRSTCRVVVVGRSVCAAAISSVLEQMCCETRSQDCALVHSSADALVSNFACHGRLEIGSRSAATNSYRVSTRATSTSRVHVLATHPEVVLQLLVLSEKQLDLLI